MALAGSLRSLATSIRGIPGRLGTHEHTVSVVTSSWSGSHIGEGTRTDTPYAVVEGGGQPPHVRWLDDEERAVGGLPNGMVEIGPITREHPGGGTSLSLFDGSGLSTGGVVTLIITGPRHPTGARYIVTDTDVGAIGFKVRAKPVAGS